jgi:hypothetical protein
MISKKHCYLLGRKFTPTRWSLPSRCTKSIFRRKPPPTISAIKETGADMGIAWDGDFDRYFFFNETGDFIEGYYI